MDRLFAAFSALPSGQQVLIWYLDVLAQPVEELAGLLGTSPDAVYSLMGEARAALRGADPIATPARQDTAQAELLRTPDFHV